MQGMTQPGRVRATMHMPTQLPMMNFVGQQYPPNTATMQMMQQPAQQAMMMQQPGQQAMPMMAPYYAPNQQPTAAPNQQQQNWGHF
jgi:hypothetical protein